MKTYIYTISILLCWGTTFQPAIAQLYELDYKNYNLVNSNIASNTITAITQDKNSFIWLGSFEGIMRFDGFQFKTYQHIPFDTTSINSNLIVSLINNSQNEIIAQTEIGIYRYNEDGDRFERLDDRYNEEQFAYGIYSDKKDLIWTRINDDIYYYKNNRKIIYNSSHDVDFDENNQFLYMHYLFKRTSPDDITQYSDNPRFDLIYKAIHNYFYEEYISYNALDQGINFDEVTRNWIAYPIINDNKNNYFYTLFNTILKFNMGTREFSTIQIPDHKSGKALEMCRIEVDQYNNLWCLAEDGMYVITAGSNDEPQYINHPYSPHNIRNFDDLGLFIDNQNNLWSSFYEKGLSFTNISLFGKFKFYPVSIQSSAGLTENKVVGIGESNRGQFVIATGSKLKLFDNNSNTYLDFASNNNDLGLKEVNTIFSDENDRLFVGCVYNSHVFDFKNRNKIQDLNIGAKSFGQGKNGDVYLISESGETFYLDSRLSEMKPLPVNQELSSLNDEQIMESVTIDNDQNIWISGNTMYLVDQSNMEILPVDLSGEIQMRHFVNNIAHSSGSYWLATTNGLVKVSFDGNPYDIIMDPTQKDKISLKTYYDAPIVENSEIYSIVPDEIGNLWLTLPKHGVVRFNISNESFEVINFLKEFIFDEYLCNGSYESKKGEIVFAGNKGVVSFHPENIDNSYDLQHVRIVDLKIFGESIEVGKEYHGRSILDRDIVYTESITMTYKNKSFSLDFVAPDYNSMNNTVYAYKLNGFNNNWQFTNSDNHLATYTNLDGGNYQFAVKASANGKKWSDETVLDIIIIPPFWSNWWFKMIIVLFVLLVIAAYFRFRIYAIAKRNIELEALVEERTVEVKEANQAKLRFFTNISHELRSPLTLILGPLENLLSVDNLGSKVKSDLHMMHRNTNRLLTLINQLMDFRKLETGHLNIKVSEGDLIKFIELLYHSFASLCEQKNIHYYFETSNHSFFTWFDADKIEKIITNLISNAIKYTPNNGRIILRCEVKDNKSLNISISDTGIGIPEDKLDKIFERFYRAKYAPDDNSQGSGIGLAFTKSLVELHKGTITVQSKTKATIGTLNDSEELQSGTTFTVTLLLGKENYSDDETAGGQEDMIENQLINIIESEEPLLEESTLTVPDDSSPVAKSARILIVEDNDDLRQYIGSFLEEQYDIEEAENGKEGLIKATDNDYDLIISDIMMPEMDGLEFCKLIKTNIETSHIPIILLTAKATEESEIEGLETLADDYITKPFNNKILQLKIKNHIDSRKLIHEKFKNQTVFEPEKLSENSLDVKFMEDVNEIFNRNMDNPEFDVVLLSKEMGLSKSSLYRKLKHLTNLSPSDFITKLRLNEAERLILNKELNFTEIAYRVGYSNVSYFSKVFKKQYGTSPSEYVKNYQH